MDAISKACKEISDESSTPDLITLSTELNLPSAIISAVEVSYIARFSNLLRRNNVMFCYTRECIGAIHRHV